METMNEREILVHEYVYVRAWDGGIVLGFECEAEKPLAVGRKLGEIDENACMNGYNWDALLSYYLSEHAPDILECMESDPEAGSYVAYFEDTPENERKARRFAEMILALVEGEEILCRLVRERGDEIEWD
ncbi:MAG: immunity 51 family protein [Alistipes sp.]|nr:immunity 51 family protein [Alistipes sp.]